MDEDPMEARNEDDQRTDRDPRPVEEVFDFVADETNEPRHNQDMVRYEKVTPGPVGVGISYEAELKSMGEERIWAGLKNLLETRCEAAAAVSEAGPRAPQEVRRS